MSQSLRSEQFRREREADWRRLDSLLQRIEKRSVRALKDEELMALPVLYRSAMSALASARATSLDLALVRYLEGLCSRAYYFIYGVRARPSERLATYLAHDIPREMKALWPFVLVSAAIFTLSALVAFLLVMGDPDWFYGFMNPALASGRDPGASAEFLRAGLYDDQGRDGLSAFASFLFTHNAQIALMCFALGFALCLPTVFLLSGNGCMLGAFVALYVSKGLGFEIGGWLMIHGVTEIFAIILAAAAGMRIGWSVGFPGAASRLEALVAAGRRGAAVMGGVVMMLACAGLLEGFGRQLINSDIARYGVAGLTALFWAAYFYLPRRASPHGR